MKRLYFILAALIISVYNVFAYTILEDFNDFLVDENQLTIRLDRLGVLAGTENLRFMVGVSGETAGVLLDNLDSGTEGGISTFRPAAIAGFGYKTDSFGIGLGYQFKYVSGSWQAHTPIITATALNDNLRINVPVTIGVGSGSVNDGDIAVSTDTRIEYYTGNNIFSRIRVNLKYGMYKLKANESRSGTLTGTGLPPSMGTVGENGKYGLIDYSGKEITFSGRAYIWQYGIDIIKEHVCYGIGYYQGGDWAESYIKAKHVHNSVLDILLCGGVTLISFIIFLLYKLYRRLRNINIISIKNGVVFISLVYLLMLQFEVYNYCLYIIFLFIVYISAFLTKTEDFRYSIHT